MTNDRILSRLASVIAPHLGRKNLMALLSVVLPTLSPIIAAAQNQLELRAVDHDSGQPVAVRMHLKDARGRPRRVRGVPYWHDHFVFDGKIVLSLPPGHYTFEMECGPEYRPRNGHFTIERGTTDNKQVDMHRFIDMKKEGWWSGDLHVQRPVRDLPLLMRAEDLHVASLTTWTDETNPWAGQPLPQAALVRLDDQRFYHVLGGRISGEGGALLCSQLPAPVTTADVTGRVGSVLDTLQAIRQHEQIHIAAETPYAWDLPVWVARGTVDSVALANSHLWRGGVLDSKSIGKQRDMVLYPGPHGGGRWSEAIYYHLLNCGLRIPPSAGSGSGLRPNPVGYNRVYVHCGGELTWEKWWQNLTAGQVVVTNGPLLQPRVNGQLPGYVFRGYDGGPVELEIALQLSTRERIEYLEIIKNGEVAEQVRLDKWAAAGGRLPPVSFTQSGWMLIRAVTNKEETYRFASTGPYYVDFGGPPRISKRSARFFLDWVYERARSIRKNTDPSRAEEAIKPYREARDFWQNLVDSANVD